MTFPAMLTLIGALLVAIGTFWNTSKQERDKTQSAQQRAAFEQEIRKRSDEQLEAQREIAELNRQLAVKSDEIAAINRDIAGAVTGGDSYCYLMLSGLGQTSGLLAVVHEGKFPLYDVNIRMVDLDILDKIEQQTTGLSFESIKQADTIIPVGNLIPNKATWPIRFQLPNYQRVRYNIFITARNGMFTETLRLQKVNGAWQSAMKLERNNYSETDPGALPTLLKEVISPDYPRDANGQVLWE